MRYLAVLISIFFVWSCKPDKMDEIIIVNNKSTEMHFIGNGVQWSAYHHADCDKAEWGHLMTDEKWQMNFERLDFMKPKIVRVMDQANWRYLKGFTSQGDPVLDFESPEMHALYKLLDYCEAGNIEVLLGEWGAPFKVHDLWRIPEYYDKSRLNYSVWTDMIVKHLDYLVNTKKYTCIRYYNLVNEPNGSWASTDGNWEQWSNGIKMLYKKIMDAGLGNQIGIAGPDVVPGKYNSKYNGADWLIKSVEELDTFIKCYDVHSYPKKEFIFSGDFHNYYKPLAERVKSTGKPLIFGELGSDRNNKDNSDRIKTDSCASEDSQMEVFDFGYGIQMADACIQAMNIGFGGVIVWDLDDAMHTLNDSGDKTQLKRWGMWNSLGTELCNNPDDENIRPWFFPWSLICRYFLPGSNIIPIESGNKMIHLVMAEKDNMYTIAVTNTGKEDYSFVLRADTCIKTDCVKKYMYTKNKYLTDRKGFPLPVESGITLDLKKGHIIKIEAQSFILLTSADLGK